MYNKKDIIKTLNEYNYFIEEQVLSSFIKNWRIDPIYEDEDGVEFFDNLSIVKLKKGISLKSQGYSNEEIVYHINKILAEAPAPQEPKAAEKVVAEEVAPAVQSTEVINPTETAVEAVAEPSSDLKNVTVDITNQTLQMLADAVAGKITSEIKQQLQCSDFMQPLSLENPLKEKNNELSKQVDELLEDNKKLAARIQLLEGRKFHPLTWVEGFIESFKR
jgi:hypothetical protein